MGDEDEEYAERAGAGASAGAGMAGNGGNGVNGMTSGMGGLMLPRQDGGGGTIVDCAECGCADFTQNVFKGKGMCSTCYHQH